MAFDVQGALSAGYSQEEINNYLRSKQTVSKAENLPIIGGIIKPISKVIRGATAGSELNKNLDTVSQSTMSQQNLARTYAKQAQGEKDPVRRKMLLDKSRSVSQGATQQLEGYVNPNLQVMPEDYAKGEGNYAVDSLQAGLAAGEVYSLPSQIIGAKNLVKSIPSVIKKTGEKITDRQGIIDTIIKLNKTGKSVTDKVSLTNKIAKDINTAAQNNPATVDYGKVLNRIVERANTELSGNVREAVIKNAAKETPKSLDLVKAIAKKRGAGYLPNAKAATAKFNELLRQELKNEIHTVAPEIAKMDEAYSVIMSGGKSILSVLKKLGMGAAGIYAGSKIFGQK